MGRILDSYDLAVTELVEFYRRLNAPIPFPDGMVTSLGIVYWGKEEPTSCLAEAIPVLKAEGIHRFRELLEAVRTPGRMKGLSERTGLSLALLRVLKHDIELWLPRPVPLSEIEPLQRYRPCLDALAAAGIGDQLEMISRCQSIRNRALLAQQTGLPSDLLDEIVRRCDMVRLGSNLGHIRAAIYYDMGWDTWQKWAASTSEEVISAFTQYVDLHGLSEVRLVPWPKEVRNGIAWAQLHLSIFEVEW